jgi:hypothetical protein
MHLQLGGFQDTACEQVWDVDFKPSLWHNIT